MTEWSIVHPWKGCVLETAPRVRIPLSPPFQDEVAEKAGRGSRVEPEQRVCGAQRNGQPKAGLTEMMFSLRT